MDKLTILVQLDDESIRKIIKKEDVTVTVDSIEGIELEIKIELK